MKCYVSCSNSFEFHFKPTSEVLIGTVARRVAYAKSYMIKKQDSTTMFSRRKKPLFPINDHNAIEGYQTHLLLRPLKTFR